MLRVFIGWDARESAAFHACVSSILRHASQPVFIVPLVKEVLPVKKKEGSNDFNRSRFLVPYLCGFNGWALYLDCDVLLRDDIVNLFNMKDPFCDVMVVKHDYQTKHETKYLGNANENYPRKNWSSVILWNCGNFPNHVLTPEFVEDKSGHYLHRFLWLNDGRIGALPKEWNWLVGEYDHNDNAKLLHYTVGSPCFPEYKDCDHSQEWHEEFQRVITPCLLSKAES